MDKLKQKATKAAQLKGHKLGNWFGHPSWPAASAMCINCDAQFHINRGVFTGYAVSFTCKQRKDYMSPKELQRFERMTI